MRISEEEKHKAKEDIISSLLNYIKDISIQIKHSKTPIKQQSIQMDVIVEVFHFLSNYDENVEALKQYYRQKNTDKKDIQEKKGRD